jgi:arylsulfatase A-like enzyme
MSPVLSACLRVSALAFALGLFAAPVVAAESKPNIIVILADDLGYGDLGCFGQKRIQTPALDRLAREGMRFTQFYSGSTVCAPARNSLMTGEHTGHALFRGNAKIDLRATDTTIAEALRPAGYATALIGKWGLGRTGTSGDPRARGFDHTFGYIDQSHAHNYYPSFLVRDGTRVPLRNVVPEEGPFGQGSATARVDYAPDLFIADALEFVAANRERPFLLTFATTLPHANNEGKPHGMEIPDVGDYAREDWPEREKCFAAMVTRLDRDVGRIVETVERLGLRDKTLIVFTSDNGPHNEGGHDAAFFDSNGPLRGTKRDLYEGGIRVPTIMHWPGHIPAGSESEVLAYFPDLFPTLTELAGLDRDRHADGISLVPTLLHDGLHQPSHDALYWEFHESGKSSQAVRLGRWKAVRKPIGTGAIELYDLETDLGETTNLADAHPDIVARASAAISASRTESTEWPTGR